MEQLNRNKLERVQNKSKKQRGGGTEARPFAHVFGSIKSQRGRDLKKNLNLNLIGGGVARYRVGEAAHEQQDQETSGQCRQHHKRSHGLASR
jgi:hypothetical protein